MTASANAPADFGGADTSVLFTAAHAANTVAHDSGITMRTARLRTSELSASATALSICVAYVYPAGTAANDTTKSLRRTAGGDSISSGSSCFADGRPNGERRVQVTGSRQGKIEFLVSSATPTLSSQSVTKFEAA